MRNPAPSLNHLSGEEVLDIKLTAMSKPSIIPVVYYVGDQEGICPECGNWNAMLDDHKLINGDCIQFKVCRDCGCSLREGEYRSVAIGINAEERIYTGIAADGVEVSLGGLDENLMDYLKVCPAPEDW